MGFRKSWKKAFKTVSNAAVTKIGIYEHNRNLDLLSGAPPVVADVQKDNKDVAVEAEKEEARLLADGRDSTISAGLKYGFAGKKFGRLKQLLGQ